MKANYFLLNVIQWKNSNVNTYSQTKFQGLIVQWKLRLYLANESDNGVFLGFHVYEIVIKTAVVCFYDPQQFRCFNVKINNNNKKPVTDFESIIFFIKQIVQWMMKEGKPCFLLLVSFILTSCVWLLVSSLFVCASDDVSVSALFSGCSAVMHAMSGQPAAAKGNI